MRNRDSIAADLDVEIEIISGPWSHRTSYGSNMDHRHTQNFADLGSTEHSVENHEMRNRESSFFA
jgi:hypothetical protein